MQRMTSAAVGRSRRAVTASLVGLAVLVASVCRASVEVGPPSSDGETVEIRVLATYPEEALGLGTRGGYDTVGLADADLLQGAGRPLLPIETVRVALPGGMTVTGVRVGAVSSLELPGTYDVAPARAPRPIAGAGRAPAPTRDPTVYQSGTPYPIERVVLLGQTDLAGQSMAILRVCPVQYVPAEKRLVVATSIEIVVEGVWGHTCGDYLPAAAPERTREAYERMIDGMVVNPGDVSLRTRGYAGVSGLLDPGVYEYVIITDFGWADDFQPLADWRTRKGSPAKIVTTMWILNLAGYSGTDTEKIRAFVMDAHATWGATQFLLGGDSNTIPDDTRQIEVPGYGVHDLANDTYFADYDDDWTNEVHVGRVSVRTPGEIAVFLQKIFMYEKDPPDDYATTAAFFGFDISEPGDGHGEISKEHIRSLHLPASWALTTEYDSEPGSHRADVIGYLNQGHHLVNHHDHCNEESMGVGWISHGDLMQTADINALSNGDRQSIMFAVGCYPCRVPYYRTIAEVAVLNPNGGAIAFMGNSGWGWGGSISDPDWYTARQDRYFYRNLFDDGFENLGENFSDLKNDAFSFDDPYNLHKYCFIQLHLLGDPGMPVWSEAPMILAVSHDDTVYLGRGTFVVHAESGGIPVEGALVCLWKGDEIYEVAETAGGDASFALAPASPGTLLVTVSHRNHVPYEGQAVVLYDPTSVEPGELALPARLALVSAVPNPFGPATEITYSVPPGAMHVRLDIYNCRGQRVRTLVDAPSAPGVYRLRWDGADGGGRPVASGVYFCEVASGAARDVRRVALIR
jgi:hypothetical protein